jgi:periplasmic copper chaperone A
MRRIALEIAVATLLTIGAAVSLAAAAMASDVMVMNAYARASATAVAKSGAVYLTIMNHGNEADRLIGVSSDIARVAHIHQTTEEDGVASMRSVDELEIGAHGEQALAPGGLHLMLIDLKKPLKEGSHFKITLQFERSGAVVVDVPVGGVAADSAEHAGHGTDSDNQ